jgi:tetratricopeptide (TPR) repeat protein
MFRKPLVWSLLFAFAFALGVRAENEGQEDLDKATELQLKVQSLRDAEQVIKLCESALQKGLDENNTKFAKQLLVSSLWQHASQLSAVLFENAQLDPRWRQIRRLVLTDLEKLLTHDAKFADAHILFAKLQALPGGDIDKARKSIDQAVELYKNDKPKLAEAIILRAQLQTEPEKQLKDFSEAIDVDPANAKAWQARAAYYITRGQLDKAIEDFEKLLEREPKNVGIRHAIAEALSNLEKHDLAVEHSTKAIELQPEAAEGYVLRARIHERKEDLAAAVTDLDQALKIEPENPLALFSRARLQFLRDEPKLARDDLKKFLQAQPDSAQGILLRSMIAAAEHNYQEAIADTQLLLRADPRNVDLRLQLGGYYVADQRPRKAIEVFTSILEEDKTSWAALRSRGDALLSVGKHKEAIKDYDEALSSIEKFKQTAKDVDNNERLKSDESGILNNLAWVLATSPQDDVRDAKRSVELGKKACEITKYEMPHIISTLAAGYAESGDFDNAIQWSTKAVELGREKLKDQIEQLEKELESYKAKKPWREMQQIEDKPDPPRRVIDT